VGCAFVGRMSLSGGADWAAGAVTVSTVAWKTDGAGASAVVPAAGIPTAAASATGVCTAGMLTTGVSISG
jgi:hypothetical protein